MLSLPVPVAPSPVCRCPRRSRLNFARPRRLLLPWFSLKLRLLLFVKLGAVTQIAGPQDLDLDGEFLYAINFSADDPS